MDWPLGISAFIVFALSMTGRGSDLYWNELHHAYYGWALMLLGAFTWSPLFYVGLVIAWDDAIQHALQNLPGWGEKRPSFLHWLYGKTLYRVVKL